MTYVKKSLLKDEINVFIHNFKYFTHCNILH